MTRRRTAISAASSVIVAAIACGVAASTPGCGGAPESANQGAPSETSGDDETGAVNSAALAAAKEKYPSAWAAAVSLLATQGDLAGRVVADVSELYRPDVQGPAYLDFALRKKGTNAGHIVASTGGHDYPIIAWNDKGSTRVRSLEQMHAVDLSTARVYMLDFATFVAERPDGSLLTGGAPMTPEAWASAKDYRIPAEKKAELAQSAAAEWIRMAKADRSIQLPADVQSDVLQLCPPTGCEGDPCRAGLPGWPACMGCTGYSKLVRGADIIDLPAYKQFNAAFQNGTCVVGCAPVAFGLVQAWAARQAGDHRDGSAWGHPRMAYAFNAPFDAWPAQPASPDGSDMNTDVKSVMTSMRTSLGGFCTSDGAGGVQYSPPYDRIRAYAQAHFNANAMPLQTWSSINSSFNTYVNEIGSNINWGIPVEINGSGNPFGLSNNTAHSWVVYGQSYSSCSGTFLKVAMGWGQSHMGEWVAQSTVINAIPGTLNLTGSGVVTFGPSGLNRDYGPITTAAGSGWCLDVEWASQANGALVAQYDCVDGTNQHWYLDRNDLTTPGWQIRARHSNKCLAAWGSGGSYNGAEMVQWDCDKNDTNTLWRIQRQGNRVALVHRMSGRCLDLDNSGGMVGRGKKIQVWDCDGGVNQTFDFAP